ncbi:unnamed protein product [Brachionus calyciflorus]|uniref:Saposin B-type domain-containing protein n=1 Tax=Brachionus calyciflorus TaxID=104777 RepID=A0A813W335_9BILA|nr:unnamed protein product [Brachionus calyciflorus]
MKNLLIISSLLLLCNIALTKSEKIDLTSVNGGTNCAFCTIIVNLVEELALVYNDTVENSLNNLCNFLPEGLFRFTCNQAVETFGPIIIDGIYSKENGDVICHALNFCHTDKGQPECNLLPKKKNSIEERVKIFKRNLMLKNKPITVVPKSGVCDIPFLKELCDYINKIFNNHVPGIDVDNDGHSTIPTFRGSSWKGKDCNDLSKNVRPGVKPSNGDKVTDSNCNGIFGKAPDSNKTYEDLFCKNSKPIGIAVLGDSISAHFSIPEQWLDAHQINGAVFEHLAFIIENELDWPQLSTQTGYMNSSWPVVLSQTKSIYLKLIERNRCNFRDYQNVGVNGARTGSMKDIVKSLSRNQKEDQPLLVTLSLVGNDVCNGHPDTLDHMTKPKEFHSNLVYILDYLDTVLPNGSHVMLTGLANGSILYDVLSQRAHPIGRVKNDVTYSDVYTYLSCLQISPCNGWMTTNDTLRKMTTDYAVMLSDIVKDIALNYNYKHFDMLYTDVPIRQMMDIWESMGGERWQLIESVDGFHINQNGNILLADLYWDILSKSNPDWIGPENQFNNDIIKLFGNQGDSSRLKKFKSIDDLNIYFVKTHKTASSALQNVLIRLADTRNMRVINKLGREVEIVQEKNLNNKIFFIHGRHNRRVAESAFPRNNSLYMTILRNPADQLVSSINYFMRLQDDREEIIRNIQNEKKIQSLGKKDRIYCLLRNSASYDLGLVDCAESYQGSEQNLIERFKQDVDFVILTEFFNEGLILLKSLLNLSYRDIVCLSVNQGTKKKETKDRQWAESIIKKVSNADVILYNYYLKKYQTIAILLKDEVNELKKQIQFYENKCTDGREQKYAYKDVPFVGYTLKKNLTDDLNNYCWKLTIPELDFLDYINEKSKKIWGFNS